MAIVSAGAFVLGGMGSIAHVPVGDSLAAVVGPAVAGTPGDDKVEVVSGGIP